MFRFRERTSLCEGDHMTEIKCKHWTDISCHYIPPGETGMNWHCHSSVENIWSVADQGIDSISSRGTAPVCKGYFDSLNHRLASHRLLIVNCVSDQYSQWYYLSISRDTSSNHHGVDNWCNVPCTNASANEGAFDVEATPISAATILPWVPLTAISAFLLKRKVYTMQRAHFDGDYIAVRAHRQEISLLALACDLLVVRAWPAFNVPW